MERIDFDYSESLNFIKYEEILTLQEKVSKCHEMLHNSTGIGNEYLGWIDLPNSYDKQEFERIKDAAEGIKAQSDVFIVIGIGGSYLGARAAISMLNHDFYNELPKDKRKGPKIYFAGYNMSSTYLNNLLDTIEGQDISINVISKSGTTMEPAISFRVLKKYIENKYGKEEASKRIYVTTDKCKGALKKQVEQEGYEIFVIPDDVGGRYSVLTPVGLLPMAVAGIDIDEIMKGAQVAARDLSSDNIENNIAYQYAVIRNLLYSEGKTIEIMASYEPCLSYFGEWYKQLLGESEGKCGKGIFPTSLKYTTDLHSMGQYVQEGRRNIFETILNVEKSKIDEETGGQFNLLVEENEDNLDGLNYLSGLSLDFVNKTAMEGCIAAHVDGGVPNLRINIPEIIPYYFGYLVYFFEKACGMSGYLLGVNPFDQPGVEAYKKNMYKLLDEACSSGLSHN